MVLIDEDDLRRRERANSVSAACFFGGFASLLAMALVGNGRALLSFVHWIGG